jgi:hypothetical protein
MHRYIRSGRRDRSPLSRSRKQLGAVHTSAAAVDPDGDDQPVGPPHTIARVHSTARLADFLAHVEQLLATVASASAVWNVAHRGRRRRAFFVSSDHAGRDSSGSRGARWRSHGRGRFFAFPEYLRGRLESPSRCAPPRLGSRRPRSRSVHQLTSLGRRRYVVKGSRDLINDCARMHNPVHSSEQPTTCSLGRLEGCRDP